MLRIRNPSHPKGVNLYHLILAALLLAVALFNVLASFGAISNDDKIGSDRLATVLVYAIVITVSTLAAIALI